MMQIGGEQWPGYYNYEIDPDDATETVIAALLHPGSDPSSQYRQRERIIRQVGGGWRRVASVDLDAERDWYVAGDPLQVLMGLSAADVVVGAVEVQPMAYIGPGRLRADRTSSPVVLREPNTVGVLRRRLLTAERRRRSGFGYCQICRRHLPPELGGGGICGDCSAYFPRDHQ